jgi:hypothetical protein
MSGRTYQTLQRYKGSLYGGPQYTGIEYDFEVPDNIVVSSPGGVSSVQHHWTKGFYGDGATTYDVYAGEGNAYPYGELGNLYQQGQTASRQMGMFLPPTDQMFTGNQSNARVENFQYSPPNQIGQTKVPGMELIAPSDSGESVKVSQIPPPQKLTHEIYLPNPWSVLAVFILMYISLDLITLAGENFLFTRLHGGKAPDWKWLALYAAIVGIIAVALGASLKDPFLGLKQFEGNIADHKAN